MSGWLTVLVILAVLALVGLVLSVRIVQQYEKGVLFRLGRVVGVREPGLRAARAAWPAVGPQRGTRAGRRELAEHDS